MDFKTQIAQSLEFIKSKSTLVPQVGITLGSGLSAFVNNINIDVEIPYSEIPHFSPPTIDGHPGKLVLGTLDDLPVAVLQGRTHFYEGHSMKQVAFPTRVLKFLGIQTLILTNAAGGIDPRMTPGSFMIITDHINLTGDNPLRGSNIEDLGPRFPDMTHTYSPELVEKLASIMKQKKVPYVKGVYVGVGGPTYETPAEIKFFQTIGGNAVGMSTVPEAIVASHMGLKLCGISCITNLASGISNEKLDHDDVKAVAKQVESQFCDFLKEFIATCLS